MSRKTSSTKGLIIAILLFIGLFSVYLLFRGAFFSPGRQAQNVIEEFYEYEQAGEFSSSWKLFHPLMKEKFSKGVYIQDRAHVFMNHFGVETFTYTMSKPEKINKWKMSKTAPSMQNVYKVIITQTYKGKYGNFDIKQEVYAVKEQDQWKVVWDYNQ